MPLRKYPRSDSDRPGAGSPPASSRQQHLQSFRSVPCTARHAIALHAGRVDYRDSHGRRATPRPGRSFEHLSAGIAAWMIPSGMMNNAWFDGIYLEDEQRELLSWMVEGERSLPQSQHDSFMLLGVQEGYFLLHPSLGERPAVRKGDLETLADNKLLRRDIGSGGDRLYEVTPQGRRYYAEMKRRAGESAAVVEQEIRHFLDGEAFAATFPVAYQRWRQAEQELWDAEDVPQMTRIGHMCREALRHSPRRLQSVPECVICHPIRRRLWTGLGVFSAHEPSARQVRPFSPLSWPTGGQPVTWSSGRSMAPRRTARR